MSNIPVIDMVFAIIIFITIIHGYTNGFIAELFSWAGLVLAMGAAVIMYPYGTQYIRARAMQNVRYVPEILAFIVIFIIVMLLVKMIGKVMKDFVNKIKLGGVDKLLGAFFGFLEGLALCTLVIFVMAIQPFFNVTNVLDESILAQILLPIIKLPMDRGKDIIHTAFNFLPGSGFPGFRV